MRLSTLPGVLLLRRSAIEDAFSSRTALAVGALLVLSAGLARNYDGEDLLAEPWWLGAPFAASLVTSFLLWCLFITWSRAPLKGMWRIYPRFLAVYWLTAPLAWLYAIPYERFLDPVQAVNANANTLLVVSLWRVLIVARALSVLFSIRFRATLAFTLMVGALVMLGAAFFGPRPVLDVMGGLRLPPEDKARGALTFATGFFSAISLLILVPVAIFLRPPPAQSATPPAHAAATRRGSTVPLVAAAFCVLAWIPALLLMQPEQRNRRTAEAAFARTDYDALFAQLRSRGPDDYPPHWRLPGAHLDAYRRCDVFANLLPQMPSTAPAWVRDGYLLQARDAVLFYVPFADPSRWAAETLESNSRYLDPAQAPALHAVLRWLIANDPALTEEQRAALTSRFVAPSATPESTRPDAP